jgi:hypothetical protein
VHLRTRHCGSHERSQKPVAVELARLAPFIHASSRGDEIGFSRVPSRLEDTVARESYESYEKSCRQPTR